MDAKTPRIALLTVGKVAQRISGLDLAGQEEILDGIHKEQPIAIAYVAALAKHGVPYETIDHVAHVVMVIFECFRQTVGPLPQISEDAIIHEYDRMQTMLEMLLTELDKALRGQLLCSPEGGNVHDAATTAVFGAGEGGHPATAPGGEGAGLGPL